MDSLIRNQQQYLHRPPSPPSDTSSPILIIAILGIAVTALLLLSYYVFVIKCWLHCHRASFLFVSQTRHFEDHFMAYNDPPTQTTRGVDESVIQSIPIFQFFRGDKEDRSFLECVVCLNEFQDEEKLRVLPSCNHVFHIDCIDIWLQSNANCPLCRSSISSRTNCTNMNMIAPSSSPQDITPFTETTTITGDEDFVVIEVRGGAIATQEREVSSKDFNSFPRKERKYRHGCSMGDECIDIREKDDRFLVQPVRRSFSMDSSTDRQLFLAVQDIIQQQNSTTSEGCSNRVRRSIFSFGSGRGTRNVALPVHFEV